MPHLRLALSALLASGALLPACAPAPAAAKPVPAKPVPAKPLYVALGDSYSSGLGTRAYLADAPACRRSTHAFAPRLARARGWRLAFRACAGATVASVARTQLAGLDGARYVSVTVGGNDAGFSRVLRECAKPGWASECAAYVERARSFIRASLPGRLSGLYRAIRARAPRAVVAVVGYPRLFMGEDCNAGTWFSPADMHRLNSTADLLAQVTGAAARARGFRYADPRGAFTGHAVCDRWEWLNGLSRPTDESFHPNRAGHGEGYLPLVRRLLVGGA